MTFPSLKALTAGAGMREDTLGWDGAVSTTGSPYSNTQSFRVWLPQPILLRRVVWRGIFRAATYQFSIDGVDEGPPLALAVAPTSDSERVVFSGRRVLPAGFHTLKLAKTGGSNGWFYVSTGSSTGGVIAAPWLYQTYWIEATGGEAVPVLFTADAYPGAVTLHNPITATSFSNFGRPESSWYQTFHRDVTALGLAFRRATTTPGTYIVTSDGSQVGESGLQQGQVFVPFDTPLKFTAGVPVRMAFTHTGGGNTPGYGYVSGITTYSDSLQTIDADPADSAGPAVWEVWWVLAGPQS